MTDPTLRESVSACLDAAPGAPNYGPFARGQVDCFQDHCEGIPLAGVGGETPETWKAPDYIPEDERAEYLRGYKSAAGELGLL